jgi:hypothetical protein
MENTLPAPGRLSRLSPRALMLAVARAFTPTAVLAPAPAMPGLGPRPTTLPGTESSEVERSPLRKVYATAFAYLALVTIGEYLTAAVEPKLGVPFHSVVLLVVLLHGAVTGETQLRNFIWVMALAPLIRVMSLSLPLSGLPFILWYFVISIPLFASAFVLVRTLGYTRQDLMLEFKNLRWQPLIMVLGPLLGLCEYLILRPTPLIDSLSVGTFALPALILLVSTGFSEELIFRGIMQRAAEPLMSRWPAAIYVNLVFAVLHAGYLSIFDVIFVFIVGMLFSWFSLRTRTLLGVTLTHGLVNQFLFLVVPFLGLVPHTPPI